MDDKDIVVENGFVCFFVATVAVTSELFLHKIDLIKKKEIFHWYVTISKCMSEICFQPHKLFYKHFSTIYVFKSGDDRRRVVLIIFLPYMYLYNINTP